MATNKRSKAGRGTGGEQPMAEKGGCLNLGWGCLPVVAVLLVFAASGIRGLGDKSTGEGFGKD